MHLRCSLFAVAAFVTLAGSAWAQGGQHLTPADQAFIQEATNGSAAEVATGRLASQKGRHEEVKMFGRWMVSSHGFAGRELASIVQRMHGQAPSAQLPPDAQQMMTKLQGLSGDEFDRAYLQGMVEDHQKDLQKFQHAAQTVQDPLLKSLAQNMVPVIQEHLQQAQDLEQDLFHAGPQGQGRAANSTVQGIGGSTQPARQ
jgi:putative membrane protein